MFAKAHAGVDIKSMMSGAGAPAASSSAPVVEETKQAEAKKEEPKKEEPKEEEEDVDMGDLFGDF